MYAAIKLSASISAVRPSIIWRSTICTNSPPLNKATAGDDGGNGNASKEQVLAMLQSEFKFETQPETMDASDGLAAALCHIYQFSPRVFGETKGKGKTGWESFVKDNPDRVKGV